MTQTRELKEELLATGSKTLAEATRDTHWGVCIHSMDGGVPSSLDWSGQNKIAQLLMEKRGRFLVNQRVDQMIAEARAIYQQTRWRAAPSGSDEETITAVVMGDSNCRNIEMKDHSTHFNVELQAIGGKDISDVEMSIEDIQTPKENVKMVLVHVGSCDLDINRKHYIDSIFKEYVEAVNSVNNVHPGVEVLISSIPERVPKAT